MSTADLVTVPVAVPREPAAYRSTVHFGQRLKNRVPEHLRDSLSGQLIEDGRMNRAGEYRPGTGPGKGTPVAFSDEIGGNTWTLIVALRPRALIHDGTHAALTLYRGPPEQTPETAGSAPGGAGMTHTGQPETPAWVDDTVGLIREDLTPETPPAGKCRSCINDPARAAYQSVTVPHISAWFQLLTHHDLARVGRAPREFGDGSTCLYFNSAGLRVEVDGDVTEPSRLGPFVSYITVRGPGDAVARFVRDLFEVADWIKRELYAPAPKPADATQADRRAVPDEERLVGRDRAVAIVRRLSSKDYTEGAT